MGIARYGVILLNLGAPQDVQRVPDFVRRMLSDPDVVPLPWPARHLLARLIARRRAGPLAEHYRVIGGRSPLGAETRGQVDALRSTLGGAITVRHAFRHSPPYAGDVLADMVTHGVRRIVAVPAYPQAARSTRGSAVRDILRAGRRAGVPVCIAPSFPDAPGYIQALIDLAGPLLHAGSHLLMCAHGIPRRAVRKGDPYLEEVARTESAFARRLPPGTRHSLAFQSRVGPMAWTGPILRDEVGRLARSGVRRLVVAPLSFVCENLETTYELDFELAAHAHACGIAGFARVPAPGCHPAFIGEMARLARRAARDAGWEDTDVC